MRIVLAFIFMSLSGVTSAQAYRRSTPSGNDGVKAAPGLSSPVAQMSGVGPDSLRLESAPPTPVLPNPLAPAETGAPVQFTFSIEDLSLPAQLPPSAPQPLQERAEDDPDDGSASVGARIPRDGPRKPLSPLAAALRIPVEKGVGREISPTFAWGRLNRFFDSRAEHEETAVRVPALAH